MKGISHQSTCKRSTSDIVIVYKLDTDEVEASICLMVSLFMFSPKLGKLDKFLERLTVVTWEEKYDRMKHAYEHL